MKSIGQTCERSSKVAVEMRSLQHDILEWCNNYAKKLLNDDDFEFNELPDPIVELAFYGGKTPSIGWCSFLKKEIKDELVLNKLLTL